MKRRKRPVWSCYICRMKPLLYQICKVAAELNVMLAARALDQEKQNVQKLLDQEVCNKKNCINPLFSLVTSGAPHGGTRGTVRCGGQGNAVAACLFYFNRSHQAIRRRKQKLNLPKRKQRSQRRTRASVSSKTQSEKPANR